MDFHGMKRKELQNLCRKHGIPANLKSSEMADRLATIFKEKEDEEDVLVSSEDSLEEDCVKKNLVESKETKKVRFSPEDEVFEFTRSLKRRLGRNGRTPSERPAQYFQDSGKGVRRSKRNVAKLMSGDASEPEETENVSSRSYSEVMEDHKVVRRSKRIDCYASAQDGTVGTNAGKLYKEGHGQGQLIEQPPVRSSRNRLEDGKDVILQKKLSDKDIAEECSLGIRVKEWQMEANTQDESKIEQNRRRSSRITANIKEPIMEGEIQEVETFLSAKDSKEERKARRSKRFAASNNAEGERAQNSVKELLLDSEVQRTEKQPMKNTLDVSEIEKVPRRSRRIGDNVNVQSAAPEINNSKLTLVDKNAINHKQDDLEVEKAPRRSKRLETNGGSQNGAPKINVNDIHIDGQTQKGEQPPKSSSVNDFQDGKLLRRSKRIAVDDDVQVGANLNNSNQHVKGQNQVTGKQHERFSDDGPELGKAVRRSKRLTANDDEQIRARRINAVEQDMEGKGQATSKGNRKCTQAGLGAGNNLRRSKRYAARDDRGAGASVDAVKNSHANTVIQVPARSTRISSRHNSKKARKVVEENLIGKKTDESLESLVQSHTQATGKMKRDRSGIPRLDTEVVSSQSSLTTEEPSAEYAQIEPEAGGISNGTEISCTKLTARSSSKKRKIADQQCTKEKTQGSFEDSSSLSVTEAIKSVKSTENIFNPQSEKSTGASEGMDSQPLSSILMAREHKEECEQDSLIRDIMTEDTEKTSLLLQFPNEGLLAGANDNNSRVQSEVKTGTAKSRTDGCLFEETGRQTTSVQLAESNLKAELVVHSAHILAKNVASTFLTKEDAETKKENSVSNLESDCNESSDVAEAVAAHAILEKSPSEFINNSVGYWKEIHPIKDDEKGSVEKDTGAASLHESFFENNTENSSAEEQTYIKVDCDTSAGKTSSEATIVPITTTLVEKMASKKKEVFDVTSPKKHSDVADIESESIRKSSLVKQTNLSVMDVCSESAREAYCIQSVSHGNTAETAEGQDTTSLAMPIGKETDNFKERMPEPTTKHHASTETSLHVIEETNLQAKVACSVTCEEIHDNVLTSDKTKEMAAKEVELVSSTEKKMEEDSRDKDVEVSLNLRNSEVSTDEEEKIAVWGEVNFSHFENLETPAKVKDDSLKKFEETKSSDRGYKQEVLDLSRCPAIELAPHAPTEEEAPKLFEGENMSTSFQPISRNKAARSHDESFIFTTPERNLMLREQLDESRKTFATESMTHYNDEAVEFPDEPVVFPSPEGHSGLDEGGNKVQNIATEFHNESNIFTSSETHMMLGSFGSNEGGKEGENTASKFHDESAFATSLERHLSLGDSNPDGVGTTEENKDMEFHGLSGIFLKPKRHLLLGDLELDVAEISKENKAAELRVESAVFAGADRHNLLEDSELDKTGNNKEQDVAFNDESGTFTGLERHLLLGDPEQDEARKQGKKIASEYHDKSAIFTNPARDFMSGDYELMEARKKGDNSAPKFHVESAFFTTPERHSLLGDSKLDEAGKGEENKAVGLHGECAIFSSPEGNLLLGNSELDEGMKGGNTAIRLLDKPVSFTSPKRHPLLEDSEPDEGGKCEENKAVELHGELSIFTSSERHLLFEDSGLHETEKKGDSTATKSHDQSAVFTGLERHLLLGDSESDEAGKNDQNKAMELDNEFVSLTSSQDHLVLGVTALVSHDESTIFTSAERHLILGDSDSDEFGNKRERSKADDLTESKGNAVTIKEAEQTTQDLEVEKNQHDNDEFDSSQSQSLCVFSPQVMLEENCLVAGRSDAILDSRESISVDSNGPILYGHKYDTVQEAASREVLPTDAEVEDFAGLKATQEASNGSQGHIPQVDSVNLADLNGEGAQTVMEVETNTCFDSHVFALRTNDIEKGPGEKNFSVSDLSNHPEVCGTEVSGPSIHDMYLINDADETLVITGDETDNNRTEELIETATEGGKSPADIIHQCEKYKDSDRNLLSDSTGSYASEVAYVLAGKEDEPSRFDSEEGSGNTSKKSGDDFLGGEATAPTVSEQNLPVFALQSEAHDSVPTIENNSQAELTFQNNINEQEDKISRTETTPSAQENSARSSKCVNKDPHMDGTNTLFERQFSCLTKRGVSREPSFILGTQVKPARHDMKENAPSSKIVQALNVTAPRASKRQPLQDLRKN